MNSDLWQKDILEKITDSFRNNEKVVTFAVFGSISGEEFDYWSDIDGLLVVEDEHYEDFANSLSWVEKFGNIFAYQKNQTETQVTLRLVFDDFKRLDFVVIKESDINNVVKPEKGPFWENINIIFSRSDEISKLLQKAKKVVLPPQFSGQQFQDLVNNFWFVFSLCLYKVARNDLLIATHLVLDLYKDCLLMGMIIRDRETDTNIHKTGGMGNEIAKNMEIKLQTVTQENILDILSQCGKEFDKLCLKWDQDYKSQQKDFQKFIRKAKDDLL